MKTHPSTKRHHHNRVQYGFPVRFHRQTGKVVEIQLYLYEQVKLARANLEALAQSRSVK